MSFRGGVQMFRDSKISTMNELIIEIEPVQHYPSIMSPVQYYPSMRQPVQHYPSIILEKSHIECFILNLWKYENLWVLVFCFEFVTWNIMKISANDVFFIQLLIYFRCRNDVRTSVSYPWARPSSQYHWTCRWKPPFLWHSLPTAFWTSWVNLLCDKIFPIFISTIC